MESRSTTNSLPQFLTLPRAARLLGISQQTLRDAVGRGDLPVYRVRRRWLRVDRAEAIAWVRSGRVETTVYGAGDCPVTDDGPEKRSKP